MPSTRISNRAPGRMVIAPILFGLLGHVYDEREFLSRYGIRSLSKLHEVQPFERGGHRVAYEPVESAEKLAPARVGRPARANGAFFRSCLAATGELMGHLSPVDTAADIERIRQALSPNEGLVAYAGSYGTVYAAAYLERYGDRVKAMVLDAVVDHSIDLPTMITRNILSVVDAFDRFDRTRIFADAARASRPALRAATALTRPNRSTSTLTLRPSVVQNHVQQGTMDFQSSIVFDKTQLLA